MKVFFSGNFESPGILIEGTSDELVEYGRALSVISEEKRDKFEIGESEYYDVPLIGIFCVVDDCNDIGLILDLEDDFLKITGSKRFFDMLGGGMVNYFEGNSSAGDFFRVDRFDLMISDDVRFGLVVKSDD